MCSELVERAERYSREEFEVLARNVVEVLRASGVESGERVVLCADNSSGYVAVLLALIHLDVSVVLLDHHQTAEERERVLRVTCARWFVHAPDGSSPGPSPGGRADGPRDLRLGDVVQRARELPSPDGGLDRAAWSGRRDALISWSSGATGRPKGVLRSGASIWNNVARTHRRMGYRQDDVLVPLLPFSHQYGLSLVLLWWVSGCSLLVARRANLTAALREAAASGATVIDAVPSMYRSLLNVLERRPQLREELRSVRLWCVGGAPLDSALAARFADTVGLPLVDGYGSTEAGNIALAPWADPVGCGHPLDGVAVEIRDPHGARVAARTVGEVHVRTPDLMEGYLDDSGVLHPAASGYFRTGDRGYQDEQGRAFVLGRDSAVHRHGYTLYPEELARKVESWGSACHVLALDEQRREVQLVFVVADPGGSRDEWNRRIGSTLPTYELPNHVLVVDSLPTTKAGKVDRAGVEALARSSLPISARPSRVDGQRPSAPTEHVPHPERLRAVRAVADHVRRNPEAVREILTEVATYRAAEEEIRSFVEVAEGAVEELARYRPDRVERLAAFMPSNVLLYSYALYVLVPSLYTERITIRPSSKVAAQTRRLHDHLSEVHGLPVTLSELSQRRFLDGPVVDADVVVFTGSYKNGENIRSEVRPDQLFVYFGHGVNPFVVTDTADLDRAVEDGVRIRLFNSGQDCFGPDVFFVHSARAEEFLAALTRRLAGLRFGGYADPDADYGPLFYEDALESSLEHLRRNGDHIVHGGQIDLQRSVVEPTVLLHRFEDKIAIPELFAPIFSIVTYDRVADLRQRLTSAFFNERAMAAMVYGDDPATVDVLARKHVTCVNTTVLDEENGNIPFGGRGMMANYVSYHGRRSAEPLLLSKVVSEHLPEIREQREVTA